MHKSFKVMYLCLECLGMEGTLAGLAGFQVFQGSKHITIYLLATHSNFSNRSAAQLMRETRLAIHSSSWPQDLVSSLKAWKDPPLPSLGCEGRASDM